MGRDTLSSSLSPSFGGGWPAWLRLICGDRMVDRSSHSLSVPAWWLAGLVLAHFDDRVDDRSALERGALPSLSLSVSVWWLAGVAPTHFAIVWPIVIHIHRAVARFLSTPLPPSVWWCPAGAGVVRIVCAIDYDTNLPTRPGDVLHPKG